MRPVGVVRLVGRLAMAVLLVAVLAVAGVPVPGLAGVAAGSAAGVPDAGVAVRGAPVDALAPARAVGRPVAEPSVALPRDGGLVGVVPPGLPGAHVVAVGAVPAQATAASGAMLRGMAGVRGPPARAVRGSSLKNLAVRFR